MLIKIGGSLLARQDAALSDAHHSQDHSGSRRFQIL